MAIIFDIDDRQSYRETFLFQPFWETVLKWLAEIDTGTPTGKYDIDRVLGIKATITHNDSLTAKTTLFDAHLTHIHVHYCIIGIESIVFTSNTDLETAQAYDVKKDIVFFKPPKYKHRAIMTPGTVVILLAKDAHHPLQQIPDSEPPIRKAVVTIPLTALL